MNKRNKQKTTHVEPLIINFDNVKTGRGRLPTEILQGKLGIKYNKFDKQLTTEQFKELEKLETTASRIRYLSNEHFVPATIARILGKSYQHVRNVIQTTRRNDF